MTSGPRRDSEINVCRQSRRRYLIVSSEKTAAVGPSRGRRPVIRRRPRPSRFSTSRTTRVYSPSVFHFSRATNGFFFKTLIKRPAVKNDLSPARFLHGFRATPDRAAAFRADVTRSFGAVCPKTEIASAYAIDCVMTHRVLRVLRCWSLLNGFKGTDGRYISINSEF